MQYSLKDLFWATALIALGVACGRLAFFIPTYAYHLDHEGISALCYFFLLFVACPGLVGGGIGALFQRKLLGAYFTAAAFILMLMFGVFSSVRY